MTMNRQVIRAILASLLGFAAAFLIACGSSTKGLIPASDAGPLQSDFETVQSAAENGDGSCAATEAALNKTSEDFTALPSSVDAGLRNNLNQGINALHTRALALCAQPLPQSKTSAEATTQSTTQTTTTQATTTPTTPTTPTETTPTTPTEEPPSEAPHGGTPAPGAGETPAPGAGAGGGTGVGEPGANAGGEAGAGGQEAGK
jgi:hypothetical protein